MNNDIKNVELGNRIEKAIAFSGKKKFEFASLMEVQPTNLSRWISGENAPSFENIVKIGKLSGVSLEWLLTGEGEPKKEIIEYPMIRETVSPGDEFVSIPQVVGGIDAGEGRVADNTIEMRVAFRRDWIRRKGDPEKMSIIRVRGDSMTPTLLDGDLVLVDHARNFIEPVGGIYALYINDQIVVKRIQVLYSTGKIQIISDNREKYPPMDVDADQIKINGKVIWYARELER